MSGVWPAGAIGALSLSFDNLGEAAEVGVGARDPADPLGAHPTATTVVPEILDELASRGLAATFFVEGLNAEVYPDLLRRIDSEGHEVAYHAWTHEQWGDLALQSQIENLARGVEAFERAGLAVNGMRPPGGALGAGGVEVIRDAGLRYCSPAGDGAGVERGVALLPFDWRHVDASCVLPGLGPSRAPAEFLVFLEEELVALGRDGGFLTIVLHPFMLDWLGAERLGGLLDRIAEASEGGGIWVARCDQAAERLLSAP
jgi:peptidoglycan/xylan/chitin deacetylase (PgdA/CDA1 family)